MTCVIVGASPECAKIEIHEGDFVIAADGGYDHCVAAGITPDLVVGDLDSVGECKIPDGVETLRYPREKDSSDMELAVQAALSRGYTSFIIYGALGGRLDHTLANIALLVSLSERGYSCRLEGENERVTAVSNGKLHIESEANRMRSVSVFAVAERATGVSLTGFKYPLTDSILERGSRGLSNEFTGEMATVEVKSGTVVVVVNR